MVDFVNHHKVELVNVSNFFYLPTIFVSFDTSAFFDNLNTGNLTSFLENYRLRPISTVVSSIKFELREIKISQFYRS